MMEPKVVFVIERTTHPTWESEDNAEGLCPPTAYPTAYWSNQGGWVSNQANATPVGSVEEFKAIVGAQARPEATQEFRLVAVVVGVPAVVVPGTEDLRRDLEGGDWQYLEDLIHTHLWGGEGQASVDAFVAEARALLEGVRANTAAAQAVPDTHNQLVEAIERALGAAAQDHTNADNEAVAKEWAAAKHEIVEADLSPDELERGQA